MIVIESTQGAALSKFFPIASGGTKLAVASGLSDGEEIPVKVKCGDELVPAVNPDGGAVKLTYAIPMALLAGEASYVFDKPITDLACQVSLGD